MHLAEVLLRGDSTLSRGERELIAAYVSRGNECEYCAGSHGASAAALLPGGAAQVAETLAGASCDAPVSAKIDPATLPVAEADCAKPTSSVFVLDLAPGASPALLPCRAENRLQRSQDGPDVALAAEFGNESPTGSQRCGDRFHRRLGVPHPMQCRVREYGVK